MSFQHFVSGIKPLGEITINKPAVASTTQTAWAPAESGGGSDPVSSILNKGAETVVGKGAEIGANKVLSTTGTVAAPTTATLAGVAPGGGGVGSAAGGSTPTMAANTAASGIAGYGPMLAKGGFFALAAFVGMKIYGKMTEDKPTLSFTGGDVKYSSRGGPDFSNKESNRNSGNYNNRNSGNYNRTSRSRTTSRQYR